MPAGRPTTYDPSYCEKIVEWGKQGISIVEMASRMDICEDTFYEWVKVHPEFSEAHRAARNHAKSWLVYQVRQMAEGEHKGNFRAAQFLLNVNHKLVEETNQSQEVRQDPTKIQIEILPSKQKEE